MDDGDMMGIKSILMVTCSYDLTCDYFIKKYKDILFFRYNTDHASDYELCVSQENIFISGFGRTLQLIPETCSIYFRKPAFENLQGIIDTNYHDFCHKENMAVIDGIIDSFEGVTLSKPSILRKSNNKIYQLMLATRLGFLMPKSTFTNSYKFISSELSNDKIVKPISIGTIIYPNEKEVIQTNLVRNDIDTNFLKFCPAYFQDFINKDYDLRITFIEDSFWPVKIFSENNIDWRVVGNKVSYELITVPEDIIIKCRKILKLLELTFGCIDFVVKDGIYYFLEVNANGQWLWLEIELGLNISEKIMGSLQK